MLESKIKPKLPENFAVGTYTLIKIYLTYIKVKNYNLIMSTVVMFLRTQGCMQLKRMSLNALSHLLKRLIYACNAMQVLVQFSTYLIRSAYLLCWSWQKKTGKYIALGECPVTALLSISPYSSYIKPPSEIKKKNSFIIQTLPTLSLGLSAQVKF